MNEPASPDLLQPLLAPRAIAILGASADPEKLNGRTVRALVDKGYAGGIYPVNPKYERIGELRCYPDVASLPDGVDLAIVATPAAIVADTLRGLAARGVRAAVVFSSGFSETGEAGLGNRLDVLGVFVVKPVHKVTAGFLDELLALLVAEFQCESAHGSPSSSLISVVFPGAALNSASE